MVKDFLARGVDVQQVSKYGKMPLQIAADEGQTEIVAKLLAAGADVNQANKDRETPLYIAARKGHTEIVAQLLEVEGIDVNKAPTSGYYEGKNASIYCSRKR